MKNLIFIISIMLCSSNVFSQDEKTEAIDTISFEVLVLSNKQDISVPSRTSGLTGKLYNKFDNEWVNQEFLSKESDSIKIELKIIKEGEIYWGIHKGTYPESDTLKIIMDLTNKNKL